jgi:hypothetical protein
MRRFLWFYLLPGIAALAGTINMMVVSRSVVEKRLESYATKNDKREPSLRALFLAAGCTAEQLSEQPVKGLKAPNLICTLKGSDSNEIVIGAHFDLVEDGSGVIDNWSGASLLPSLYEGIAGTPRRHTFRFVGFSGEEKGLVGSKAYVEDALREHERIAAMINMDTLGLGETEIWVSQADPGLVKWIQVTAASMKLPLSGMNVDGAGDTDSTPFHVKKIPAITLHSVTSATLRILHSPRDRIEAIDRNAYYRSYQLILAYLAVLDDNVD